MHFPCSGVKFQGSQLLARVVIGVCEKHKRCLMPKVIDIAYRIPPSSRGRFSAPSPRTKSSNPVPAQCTCTFIAFSHQGVHTKTLSESEKLSENEWWRHRRTVVASTKGWTAAQSTLKNHPAFTTYISAQAIQQRMWVGEAIWVVP